MLTIECTFMQQVPQELKEHFHYVRVNIRPNPGQLVKIRKLKLRVGKKYVRNR